MRMVESRNGQEIRSVESVIDVEEYHRLPVKSGYLERRFRSLEYQLVNPNQPSCQCGCGVRGKL